MMEQCQTNTKTILANFASILKDIQSHSRGYLNSQTSKYKNTISGLYETQKATYTVSFNEYLNWIVENGEIEEAVLVTSFVLSVRLLNRLPLG